MKLNQFLFVTLLYVIIILFINQVLIYNVTLVNLRISSQSFLWSFILVYNIFVTFVFLRKLRTPGVIISNYLEIVRYVSVVLLMSLVLLIINDLITIKETNIITYLKFVITLFFVSMLASLTYFLELSFYKYRVLWIVGFVGTVILAPLLVEAGMFVRDLRFKSLLDFWNWIVPYQAIEQLRQFVLLEGWQGWDVALMSIAYLVVYWFVVASICLYIRQLQVSWKLPEVAR